MLLGPLQLTSGGAGDRHSVFHICVGTVPSPHRTLTDGKLGCSTIVVQALPTQGQLPGAWMLPGMESWSWLVSRPLLSSQAPPREPPHSTQATSKDKVSSMEVTEHRRRDLLPSSSGLMAMSRQAFSVFQEALSAECQTRPGKDFSYSPECD